MRHNGVAFPPDYEPRGITTTIKGRLVRLEPLQEEMLMAWAKKVGTPYVQDTVFQDNFLLSLREQWADLFTGVTIDDIDWSEMVAIAQAEKLANLPEEKRKEISAQRKILREELKVPHGSLQQEIEAARPRLPDWAIDGLHSLREIGNFALHPKKDQSTGDVVQADVTEAALTVALVTSA